MATATPTGPTHRQPAEPDLATSTRTQLGVYVFLASDLMLFAPFFAAYFLLRTNVETWPPADVRLDTSRAVAATIALVASSGTLALGHHAARSSDLARLRRWLLVTVVLGGIFLANQLAEYATLEFRPGDHTYSSIYWLLTGLHTLHVSIGLLVLVAIVARTFRVVSVADLGTWLDGGGAFWHLVDVVWIGVFLTIWVIR